MHVDAENVIIRTPYHKSIEEINDIVRGKANWIKTKQAEYKSESPEIVKPVFQEGSTLPYLGVNYPFRMVNGHKESNENVKLVNGEFQIFSRSSSPSRKHIRFLYEEWLLQQAQSIYKQKTKLYCTELNIKPPRVIILHELCHLKIKEHSHHFWDLLRKFMPDYQEKVKWLRINGSNVV